VQQQPGETYEQWVRRVEQYEFGRALMRLAQGNDPESVMQEASHRIMKKIQHPVIRAISDSAVSSYDSTQSLAKYHRNYTDLFGPKSDHIQDN
jgi:glutamyl-tRNA reductase